MQANIEKLAVRIGEGFLASGISLAEKRLNAFHREVYLHKGSDLAFINGLVSTGLRSSAFLAGNEFGLNSDNIRSAARRLLPVVIHTSSSPNGQHQKGYLNIYEHMRQISGTHCFVLIAGSASEEMQLSLIAQRISELSLVPGIVVANHNEDPSAGKMPSDDIILRYLGDPDDQIPSPTPGQEIIFGKVRRRVPNWFNLDTPVISGIARESEGVAVEAAARREFIYAHLEELIERAYREYEELTGVHIPQVSWLDVKRAHAFVTLDNPVAELLPEAELKQEKTDIIRISRIAPFPEKQLSEALAKRKSVTFLEPLYNLDLPDEKLFTSIKNTAADQRINWHRAYYRDPVTADDIRLVIDDLIKGSEKAEFYLGIPFNRESGEFPKHDILLKEIQQNYPGLAERSITVSSKAEGKKKGNQVGLPLSLRAYKDQGANYSHLARFFADTAFFYATDRKDEIVADPFEAAPVIPAATGGMLPEAGKAERLPEFHPEKCTACGDCYLYCPHAAVRPLAIKPSDLAKTGIRLASEKGHVITRLTPMVRHFDKLMDAPGPNEEVKTAGDVMPGIFRKVADQMKTEGENLVMAENEFDLVLDEIGKMPVALTEPVFTKPESIEKGKGELFTIAFDPASCTACGICAEVCNDGAIEMAQNDENRLKEMAGIFKLWEQLPDTSGETINRLYHDPDYSPFAALMMSRNYAMSMIGGHPADEGGPHKTLLHWVTSTAEAVIQPRYIDMMSSVDELIEKIGNNIHQKLSKALPKDNLEELANALDEAKGKRMSLRDIVSRFESDEPGSLIDSNDMRRKTHLLDELKTLKWVLHEGPGGVGRSRYGMLLAAEASMPWAREFPRNHFTSPVVVHWSGSATAEALGIFYGNLRFALDQFKLIRRAKLEAKDKYDPAIHDLEIAGLNWDDLDIEEKQLVPPLLIIADRQDLEKTGWNSLTRLLADRYPVKVVVFDSVAPAGNEEIASLAVADSGLLSAIALKNAFVYQGGAGNARHLYEGLMDGLAKTRPALFMLYVTDPFRHSVEMGNWSHYAVLAANSRSFPIVRFDPEGETDHLGSSIDLSGNEAMLEDWVREEVETSEGNISQYTISWADWAFTQKEWNREFSKVEEDPGNVPVPEFLELDDSEKATKVPVITRISGEEIQYYEVSDRVVAMTAYVRDNWRTLQELAGLRSEFPEQLKKKVESEYDEKLKAEKDRLEKEYKEKLDQMEASQAEMWRKKLKERLIALSKMARKEMES